MIPRSRYLWLAFAWACFQVTALQGDEATEDELSRLIERVEYHLSHARFPEALAALKPVVQLEDTLYGGDWRCVQLRCMVKSLETVVLLERESQLEFFSAYQLLDAGVMLNNRGHIRRSQDHLKTCHSVFARLLGAEAFLTIDTRRVLAITHVRMDEFDDAKAVLTGLVAICERVLGTGHPLIAHVSEAEFCVYSAMEDYQQAEESARRAMRVWERIKGAESENYAKYQGYVVESLLRQGRTEEAAAEMKTLEVLYAKQGLDISHRGVQYLRANQALQHKLARDWPAALLAIEEVIRVRETEGDKRRRVLLTALELQVEILREAGQQEKADAVAARAKELRAVLFELYNTPEPEEEEEEQEEEEEENGEA